MYKIVHYHPDMFGGVLEVIEYLHGNQHDVNRTHFQWKYHDNPYSDRPLGIVALHNGKTVGFRGYFATAWTKAMILMAGDTVVHPDHRKKGLSVAMGEAARDEYKSQYEVLMNFSGTLNSVPGYKRLGFVPLIDKAYLYRDGFDEVRFDDVHESQPEAVRPPDDVIALIRDDRFFQWRLQNNKKVYKCYRCEQDYIIIGQEEHMQNGLILDYTENDIEVVKRIILHACKAERLFSVMIKDFNLSDNFSRALKGLGFKERGKRRIQPVLVRPTGDDWFIDGLDIRKIESWELRGICSDNV